jgi:hypothetical protein
MTAKGFKRVGGPPQAEAAPMRAKAEEVPAAPGSRRDPATALAVAAAVAPTFPPTRVEVLVDPVAQLNLKVRTSLIDQLAEAAGKEGTTQKVIVCRALAKAGFRVHEDDLSDRGNHRRRRG